MTPLTRISQTPTETTLPKEAVFVESFLCKRERIPPTQKMRLLRTAELGDRIDAASFESFHLTILINPAFMSCQNVSYKKSVVFIK